MAITLRLQNFDRIFEETTNEKFILNNEDLFSQENKEKLDTFIMKNYADDNLSLIPSCSCEELKGTYYVGETCVKCDTMVSNSVTDGLNFLVWVQQPVGVRQFISPMVLAIITHRYKIRKFNIPAVTYIMSPGVRIDSRYRRRNIPELDKLNFLLEKEGLSRGYNNFVDNFFKIIKMLEDNQFSRGTKKSRDEFYDWLWDNRENIFSSYLPFPNKSVFVIDSNELGSFVDRSLLEPLNAMRRLTGIDIYKNTVTSKQAKVARSLQEMSSFYIKYMTNSFFIKPGLIRQHISSTRSHFTMRAVITSIAGPHVYNEIQLPWSASCTLFREHLLKGLYLEGFNYKQATNHLLYHNRIYCPILDKIFKRMVEFSGGIDAILNRNPSLHRGSVQSVVISRIKTDTDDNTIGMSYLIAPNYNADYDGDELNLTLVLTKKAKDQLVNFQPHHSVLGLRGPNEFGNAIQYPKTIISTLSSWYNKGSRQ